MRTHAVLGAAKSEEPAGRTRNKTEPAAHSVLARRPPLGGMGATSSARNWMQHRMGTPRRHISEPSTTRGLSTAQRLSEGKVVRWKDSPAGRAYQSELKQAARRAASKEELSPIATLTKWSGTPRWALCRSSRKPTLKSGCLVPTPGSIDNRALNNSGAPRTTASRV